MLTPRWLQLGDGGFNMNSNQQQQHQKEQLVPLPKDYATKFLDQIVTIKIDRPLGSNHPKWGFHYPINYGYVPGIMAPDGEELDAYLLGITEPVLQAKGKCIAVIHRIDDDDDKLVIVPPILASPTTTTTTSKSDQECHHYRDYSDEEIRSLVHFQEQYFTSIIIRSPSVAIGAEGEDTYQKKGNNNQPQTKG